MNSTTSQGIKANPYECAFDELVRTGATAIAAAEIVAESYLDGKPRTRGKHKITTAERDTAFWASSFLCGLPRAAWHSEPLVLAVARYLGQERVANPELLEHIAVAAPATIHRAVRYSGIVLNQHSPRRTELDQLARLTSSEFVEMLRVLDIFDQAFRERQSAVEMWKSHLADLSPLELLMYASLHAFENWVPGHASVNPAAPSTDSAIQAGWDAVNDLFIWKLTTAADSSTTLTDEGLGGSLKAHLAPFLFPSSGGSEPKYEKRGDFENLLNAQIELNNFIAQSANAFSYDDSIQFVRNGAVLEIRTVEPAIKEAWERCVLAPVEY